MTFLERLQLASEEGWGNILYLVGALLVGFVFAYWLLVSYKKKKSVLSLQEEEYLTNAIAMAKRSGFDLSHKKERGPLGSNILGKDKDGNVIAALVPFSACLNPSFHDFLGTYGSHVQAEAPGFTVIEVLEEQKVCMIIQTLGSAKWQLLSHHLLDKKMSAFEVEAFLLQLALVIASYHMITPIEQRKMYHGLISPETIMVSVDERDCIQQVCIKDHGFVWSYDHKKWLSGLASVHPRGLAYFEEKLHYAAPELKDEAGALSPAIDFYSFGQLAHELFRKNVQEASANIEEAVPKRWRGFVNKCLKENAKERPTDFLELDDLLNDPEMNAHFSAVEKKQAELNDESLAPLKNARELFLKLREKQGQKASDDPDLDKGFTLLRNRQWKKAIHHFEGLEKEESSPKVLLGLAIGLHQKGERDRAEKVYNSLKAQDPKLVSEFHRFLAKGF